LGITGTSVRCQSALAEAGEHGHHRLMSTESQAITVLTEDQCWELLSGINLGRLVTDVEGRPDIFPVNFAVQNRTVLFRTAEGTKLVSTVVNDQVLFEADDHTDTEAWSVIVRGTARTLSTFAEIEEAEAAGLRPWIATTKPHYVRITPHDISGRRFVFGPEPERTALIS